MIQTLAIICVPAAMVLVSIITGVFNRNVSVTALRRDEDEKRGQRITTLEDRITSLEAAHRDELVSTQDRYEKLLNAERSQRHRCESVIYALRNQIIVLRGALVRAGIDVPPTPDIDY
mgnify:CR=1 FL=1